jgi:hypothetical protein
VTGFFRFRGESIRGVLIRSPDTAIVILLSNPFIFLDFPTRISKEVIGFDRKAAGIIDLGRYIE